MKRLPALFIAFALTLIIIGNYYFFFGAEDEHRERVLVTRVIDGDTLDLADGRRVRLININTPEKKERGHDEALAFLQKLENTSVEIDIRGTEKYGRTLGALYTDTYVNLEIVRQGLASTFLVSDEEAALFAQAEDEARAEGKGIWAHSPYYGCLAADINKKDEIVRFTSSCASTLAGWTIKDETTHAYTLPAVEGTNFELLSASGVSRQNRFYWGREAAWNNDRDSLFVRDENSLLVLFERYGY